MIEIVIVVLCLLANALIAGAEMAFVAVSRPSLRELVRQRHTKADILLRLRERPERTLAVMQIGITLVAALAGAVGGAGAEEQLSPLFEKLGVNESTGHCRSGRSTHVLHGRHRGTHPENTCAQTLLDGRIGSGSMAVVLRSRAWASRDHL
jgi:CBS domain containing-hemolysin-like protein